jgi:hypothetical protein
VVGDNPGVYEPAAQTEWWPFLPAAGVVVGVCLAVMFVVTIVMALKRQLPASWVWVSGLSTIVIFGFSTFGCLIAVSQYEVREREHHDLYVARVADWVSDEIGGEVNVSDTARLLDGESLTAQIDGTPSILHIEQDRPADLLHLFVNQAAENQGPVR